MTKGKRFELEVEAALENLSVIGHFIADTMEGLGADQETIYKVQLAVDEACTNIVQHAYSGRGGRIRLICAIVDDEFIIKIRDKGRPFDPNSVPVPDLGADLDKRKIGGLGIYFMKKMMDEISYKFDVESGNELTMRKRLTAAHRAS